ncbi:MAG: winged helix-turn-helix domain-containing protein [Aestuariibacter sp.]
MSSSRDSATKPVVLKTKTDLQRVRRLALSSQGLLHKSPFGKGQQGARSAIEHIGYVQIDTISVIERAHHHALYTRVPGYQPKMLNNLLKKRDIFEYWSHAAAFLPIRDFRFSLPYKQAIKSGQTHWYKNTDRKLMANIIKRIRDEGPLRSRDLESHPNKKQGWWDWKPAKKAIEQLYMEGDLMVCDREGFQKTYDLTERVLPSDISTEMPNMDELADHLLEQKLRCHGLVTLKGLTYLRRNGELRKAMKTRVDEYLSQQRLEQMELPNGEIFFVKSGALEQTLPRSHNRLIILSPFDNSVIQRDRLSALFEYNYQIECYVPEPKRQFGYFCLPLLFRNTFIGRMDCKAHRKNKHLEIKSLHLEEAVNNTEELANAFAEAMVDFCRFQNCETVSLSKINIEPLSHSFHQALDAHFH